MPCVVVFQSHILGNQQLQIWIQFPVDQTLHTIFDVALSDQAGLVRIIAITYRGIRIGELEDLEAFKLVGVVRERNQRILLFVIREAGCSGRRGS